MRKLLLRSGSRTSVPSTRLSFDDTLGLGIQTSYMREVWLASWYGRMMFVNWAVTSSPAFEHEIAGPWELIDQVKFVEKAPTDKTSVSTSIASVGPFRYDLAPPYKTVPLSA